MGFFRQLLSPDLREARTAEAAGDPDRAATHYGLAGDREGAVRMHLARAARAADRAAEIACLRDALHWAGDEPTLVARTSAALGRALVAKLTAEGVATARDRERLREAAELLTAGAAHREAGEAYRVIGDLGAAAAAFSAAGLIDKVEATLGEDEARAGRERQARAAFADYELALGVGRRSDARTALVASLAAEPSDDRQRLLDQLAAELITSGRVELRPRGGDPIVATSRSVIGLGRDAVCELPLRTGGVSRRHAEIELGPDGFALRDAGSRNGTLIGGLPVVGRVPLAGRGAVELGEDCRIEFAVEGGALYLRVATGLDRGRRLVAAPAGRTIELAPAGLACTLRFVDGAPWLGRPGAALTLGTTRIGAGEVQLMSGDVVSWDDVRVDVTA